MFFNTYTHFESTNGKTFSIRFKFGEYIFVFIFLYCYHSADYINNVWADSFDDESFITMVSKYVYVLQKYTIALVGS